MSRRTEQNKRGITFNPGATAEHKVRCAVLSTGTGRGERKRAASGGNEEKKRTVSRGHHNVTELRKRDRPRRERSAVQVGGRQERRTNNELSLRNLAAC